MALAVQLRSAEDELALALRDQIGAEQHVEPYMSEDAINEKLEQMYADNRELCEEYEELKWQLLNELEQNKLSAEEQARALREQQRRGTIKHSIFTE